MCADDYLCVCEDERVCIYHHAYASYRRIWSALSEKVLRTLPTIASFALDKIDFALYVVLLSAMLLMC